VWVATLDDSTRKSHGVLDGQIADEKGLFYINGLSAEAPGHFGVDSEDIHCRCTTIARLKESQVRRTREGIIPYTNYKDWLDNRVRK